MSLCVDQTDNWSFFIHISLSSSAGFPPFLFRKEETCECCCRADVWAAALWLSTNVTMTHCDSPTNIINTEIYQRNKLEWNELQKTRRTQASKKHLEDFLFIGKQTYYQDLYWIWVIYCCGGGCVCMGGFIACMFISAAAAALIFLHFTSGRQVCQSRGCKTEIKPPAVCGDSFLYQHIFVFYSFYSSKLLILW